MLLLAPRPTGTLRRTRAKAAGGLQATATGAGPATPTAMAAPIPTAMAALTAAAAATAMAALEAPARLASGEAPACEGRGEVSSRKAHLMAHLMAGRA